VRNKEVQNDMTRAAAKAAAEASWPPTRVILRVLFIVLVVAVTLWVIVKLTGVILLLVLSIFFAYLVSPLVEFLRRPIKISGRHLTMPRALAIALAYLFIVAAVVVTILFVVPQLGNQFPEFAEQARGYWKTLGEKTQGINEYFRLHRMPGPVVDALNRAALNVVGTMGELVRRAAEHAGMGRLYSLAHSYSNFELLSSERRRELSSLSAANVTARTLALARRRVFPGR